MAKNEDFQIFFLLVRRILSASVYTSGLFERLFERFYRVENSGNRTTGGSGLGLAIVKHIIDAHNEKIYVESDFGVGSEFSFSLQKSN